MQNFVKQLDSILETWGAANFITEGDQNDVRHALGQLRAQLAATPAPASDEVLAELEEMAKGADWALQVGIELLVQQNAPMAVEHLQALKTALPALLARARQAEAAKWVLDNANPRPIRVADLSHLSPAAARELEQATLAQISRHLQQARTGEMAPELALAVVIDHAAYLVSWVQKLTREPEQSTPSGYGHPGR